MARHRRISARSQLGYIFKVSAFMKGLVGDAGAMALAAQGWGVRSDWQNLLDAVKAGVAGGIEKEKLDTVPYKTIITPIAAMVAAEFVRLPESVQKELIEYGVSNGSTGLSDRARAAFNFLKSYMRRRWNFLEDEDANVMLLNAFAALSKAVGSK